ncbi:uncharacterized protein LOC141664966 [Apium graveolens]|uniref:uncharacterized protein LOC141664966 n=1 Tax=Apium graveolens TaxID=4045 RepID=UPI003D7B1792
MVATQFNICVKCVRTDNDTEFVNTSLTHSFKSHGILHQMSCVHCPQQNGRAERKHKHLLAVARALKFRASLPIHLWGDQDTALFPSDTHFIEDINTSHFSSQQRRSNSESHPITTSSHIHTDSNDSVVSGETPLYTESAHIINNSSETIVPPTFNSIPATSNPPVRPAKVKSIPHKFKDFTDLPNFLSNSINCTVNYPLQSVDPVTHLGSTYQNFVANSMKIVEPTTYRQAVIDPLWCEAMQTELNALKTNKTCQIVNLPPKKRLVGCK